MTAVPRISVGLPVFNGERYLVETLASLLGQTLADFELLISDNASTDATEEICREHAKRDPRIVYERLDRNTGAAANYNHVARRARAPYFKWNAADDLCAPDVFEKCYRALEDDADAVLAYPASKIIDGEGIVLQHYPDPLDVTAADPYTRLMALFKTIGECNAVFGLTRTAVLENTPLIGKYLASDMVLLGELSLYGRFIRCEDTTFFRRDHPEASSSDKSQENMRKFYEPGSQARLPYMRQWRVHGEFLRAIRRSPLARRDKARLYRAIMRNAVACRRALAGEVWAALRSLGRGRPKEHAPQG
ncbi:MAG: glycosyltransferase [Planctomycetota bacterium]|nr:glycosyltransferase [Planctomycetota bacterium]